MVLNWGSTVHKTRDLFYVAVGDTTLTATISSLPFVHGDFTPGAQGLPAQSALILRPTTSVPQFSELCSDFYSQIARQTYIINLPCFSGFETYF
jgi:hypothetical protein